MKRPTVMLWHKDHDLQGVDCVVLPGGFSYGDYLRSGAIARFSPLMQEVKDFAREGGLVLGICNGFQVLLELGLLPGAMLRNKNLKFLCQHVHIRVENARTRFHPGGPEGPGPAHPHRPLRRQLLRPARDAEGPRAERPGRLPLLRRRREASTEEANVNGSLAQHRRHPEQGRATSWA